MKLSGFWPVIIYQIIRILMKNLKFTLMLENLHLEAFIIQKDKPIAFYNRKLTDTQKSYTLTEKYLLIIVVC